MVDVSVTSDAAVWALDVIIISSLSYMCGKGQLALEDVGGDVGWLIGNKLGLSIRFN